MPGYHRLVVTLVLSVLTCVPAFAVPAASPESVRARTGTAGLTKRALRPA